MGERGRVWLQAVAMARDIRAGSVREPELDLLKVVRPGEVVVDVGANYGFWTAPASKAVGPEGQVIAVEPMPFTVETLRRILRLLRLRNVTVHPVACGEEPARLDLTVPVQDVGAISAGQAHFSNRNDARLGHEVHVRWQANATVSCPVARLDDLVPEDAPVALVKIDVEGAELLVVRGSGETLRRCRPLIVAEINPWFLEGFGLSVADLVTSLDALGYDLYHYEDAERRIKLVSIDDVVEDNYVFVHREERAKLGSLLPSP